MPSTTYEWKVRSNCEVESSGFSSIETFTTFPLREEKIELNDLINIYPNPTKGKINIVFDNQIENIVLVTILDISGKLIKSLDKNIVDGFLELDMTEFPAGFYILKFNTSEAEFIQKVVKE